MIAAALLCSTANVFAPFDANSYPKLFGKREIAAEKLKMFFI